MSEPGDSVAAEYRRLLEECETQAAADFDKTAMALSGGALGISLAFLKDIAPNPAQWSVWWLLAPAWGLLVVSLLLIFISLMTSMESMRYELQCLSGKRTKPQGEAAGGQFRLWTHRCNYGALGSCVLGITLLLVFAVLNAGKDVTMDKPAETRSPTIGPTVTRGRITPDRPTPAAPVDVGLPTGAGRITPDPPSSAPAVPPASGDKK